MNNRQNEPKVASTVIVDTLVEEKQNKLYKVKVVSYLRNSVTADNECRSIRCTDTEIQKKKKKKKNPKLQKKASTKRLSDHSHQQPVV